MSQPLSSKLCVSHCHCLKKLLVSLHHESLTSTLNRNNVTEQWRMKIQVGNKLPCWHYRYRHCKWVWVATSNRQLLKQSRSLNHGWYISQRNVDQIWQVENEKKMHFLPDSVAFQCASYTYLSIHPHTSVLKCILFFQEKFSVWYCIIKHF